MAQGILEGKMLVDRTVTRLKLSDEVRQSLAKLDGLPDEVYSKQEVLDLIAASGGGVDLTDYLKYNEANNIVIREKAKILGTDENQQTHNLLGLYEYLINGSLYDQIEVGAPSYHLNFNTNNDPTYGFHITVDTTNGKEVLIYQSDLDAALDDIDLSDYYNQTEINNLLAEYIKNGISTTNVLVQAPRVTLQYVAPDNSTNSLVLNESGLFASLYGENKFYYNNEEVATKKDIQDAVENIEAGNITIADADQLLTNDSAGLRANLSVVVEGTYAVLYGKDDTNGDPIEIGRINVSIGAIESAQITEKEIEGVLTKVLEIVVVTTTGTTTLDIPVSELVDVYTGSTYIDINEENVISLNYNELHDALLNSGLLNAESAGQIFFPYSGGIITGTTTMYNGNFFQFGSSGNRIRYDSSNTVLEIYSTSAGGVNIRPTVGILAYNGIQVATIDDIPDVSMFVRQSDLTAYVNIAGAQTITGSKTFTGNLNIGGSASSIFRDSSSRLTLNSNQGINLTSSAGVVSYNDVEIATKNDIPQIPDLSTFVTTNTEQEISGKKTFEDIAITGDVDIDAGEGSGSFDLNAATVRIAGEIDIAGALNFSYGGRPTYQNVGLATLEDIEMPDAVLLNPEGNQIVNTGSLIVPNGVSTGFLYIGSNTNPVLNNSYLYLSSNVLTLYTAASQGFRLNSNNGMILESGTSSTRRPVSVIATQLTVNDKIVMTEDNSPYYGKIWKLNVEDYGPTTTGQGFHTHDTRYTYTGSSDYEYTIQSFANPALVAIPNDGFEVIFAFKNAGTGTLTVNMPETDPYGRDIQHDENSQSFIVEPSRIAEVSVRFIYNTFVFRLIGV